MEASEAEAEEAGNVKKMQRNVANRSNIPFSFVKFRKILSYVEGNNRVVKDGVL